MLSEQQRQTLAYFDENAAGWQVLANESGDAIVNTLRQRYQYGWRVAEEYGPFERVLDIGCGAGDALWPLAEKGAECLGVDFAPQMISLATEAAKKKGLDRCHFNVGNALEFAFKSNHYDLIISYGLVEYFSWRELEVFFERVKEALSPGGTLIVESRNRLFNLVTFNDYTAQEMETGNLQPLFKEALVVVGATSMQDCVARLMSLEVGPTPLHAYPLVGVPVKLRHQYTPAQLCRLLHAYSLEPQAVSGYHYHGVVPRLKDEMPSLHSAISNRVQNEIFERHEAITHCSSFMVRAKRC
jgi:2-polyprenyl-3-methyl-5-hydroxy-6-metoxy-1,4-benzoquinol methylase